MPSHHDNGWTDWNENGGSGFDIVDHRPDPWSFLGGLGAGLGLAGIGVAPAAPVAAEAAAAYRAWLDAGLHGGLDYSRRNLAERLDPRQPRIHPRSAAVISIALPYGQGAAATGIWRHVAAHARSCDYHLAVRRALFAVDRAVRERFPRARTRRLADTAPVMERWWASACGLGFIGRHGGLVIPGHGARVVLGEIIAADVPAPEPGAALPRFAGCGDCRACLDACPTGALVEPGLVDCRRCLSFHSVENPGGPVPDEVSREMTLIFGCDACTAACPLEIGRSCALEPPPNPGPPDLDPPGLAALPDNAVAELIRGTALERTGAAALRRNAALVASNRCLPPGSVG
jgi:epoxyqueuosine reductase